MFVLIRIRHRDNKNQEAQVAGFKDNIANVLAIAVAGYKDWKPVSSYVNQSN